MRGRGAGVEWTEVTEPRRLPDDGGAVGGVRRCLERDIEGMLSGRDSTCRDGADGAYDAAI